MKDSTIDKIQIAGGLLFVFSGIGILWSLGIINFGLSPFWLVIIAFIGTGLLISGLAYLLLNKLSREVYSDLQEARSNNYG